jgi:hypothetical protein
VWNFANQVRTGDNGLARLDQNFAFDRQMQLREARQP